MRNISAVSKDLYSVGIKSVEKKSVRTVKDNVNTPS